jgi:hypothetical protein
MLSEDYKQKLLNLLKLESDCRTSNIKDKSLLIEVDRKKRELLIDQYEGIIRKNSGSIDKIIRLNKIHKDRV